MIVSSFCAANDIGNTLASEWACPRGKCETEKSETAAVNSGPLLYYHKFDEDTGSSAADSSGNNQTATIGGGATWTTGRVGSALNFPGAGYVAMRYTSYPFATNQLTMQGWLNPNSTTGTQNIIYFDRLVKIQLVAAKIQLSIFYNSAWTIAYTSTASIATGTWTHFTATYNGGTKLYINGVIEGNSTGVYAISSYMSCSASPSIGSESGSGFCGTYSNFFNGKIDEVYVYNVEKSAADIAAYYASIP